MRTVLLGSLNDFAEWRATARSLLLAGVPPDEVTWVDPASPRDLFAAPPEPIGAVIGRAVGTVPPRFVALAGIAICHSDPDRFALLYRLLWRLQKDKGLLELRDDPDVGRLERRATAVRHDLCKLKADIVFVEAGGRHVAWFEPEFYVLELAAPDFAERFIRDDWMVVTPYRSLMSTGGALSFGPGGTKSDVPAGNPDGAALIAAPGEAEMSAEAERDAGEHEEMTSLAAARAAVQGCTRCRLHEFATQAVFGEGPAQAEIMFVGEQPGESEDLEGKPFIGPAGQVFDRAMKKAGLHRREFYVTNAVKHFKFVPRGKKRLHQRPNAGEIQACRFWLNLEREFVKPRLIVAMGATAVQSVLGQSATISSLRGKPMELDDGTTLFLTVHPSYLLRIPDRNAAAVELERFEADLKAIGRLADKLQRRAAS